MSDQIEQPTEMVSAPEGEMPENPTVPAEVGPSIGPESREGTTEVRVAAERGVDTEGDPRPSEGDVPPGMHAIGTEDAEEGVSVAQDSLSEEARDTEGHAEAAAGDATQQGGEQADRRKKRKPRKEVDLSGLTPGMELTGTVRSIQTYGAFVDIGLGRDGLVHISELKDGFVEKVEDVVKPGDAVTVRIKEVDQDQGRISLTMRPPKQERERERTPRRPREGQERTAEGGSAPSGEASASNESEDLGQDEGASDQSRRARHERFRDDRPREDKSRRIRLKDLTDGQEFTGKVTSIVDFGAFVDIGATTDGLVHISELSDDRVHKVTDMVQEGQEVKVRVLQVDRKRNRISLTMREPQQLEMPEAEDDDSDQLPTLFEAAFQRASERARKRERRQDAKKGAATQQDALNDIIRRTLEQHRSG